MKIMIVEDHAEMRRMLRSIVADSVSEPLHVIECASGEEAVDQYSTEHPDCVLMDFQLGKMNGFEAIEIIRAHDKSAFVVMVTGHDSPGFKRRAKQLHLNGFVSKENLAEIPTLLQNITNK